MFGKNWIDSFASSKVKVPIIAVTFPLTKTPNMASGYRIQCQVTNDHECATTFADPGDRCIDLHDGGGVSDAVLARGLMVESTAKSGVVGRYTVSYDCTDVQGNTATKINRDIRVKDTIDPELTLKDSHIFNLRAGGVDNEPCLVILLLQDAIFCSGNTSSQCFEVF
jgi:hypothetical protein